MAQVRPATALYFTTVIALDRNLAVLGGHLFTEEADPTVTRFMVCYGDRWGSLFDLPDIVYATAQKPPGGGSKGSLCFLGRQGLFRETIRGGGASTDVRISIANAGYLMDLRLIQGALYACGGQNQVHRQDGQQWRKVDQGLFSPLGDHVDRSLDAIDGFADNDIYAVGMGGAIWHWDGKNWTRLDSPTNYSLFSVLCASSGDVYVGGSKGTLFKGHKDRGWQDLSDAGVTESVLEDMTEFQGKVYVTATDVLAMTDGGPMQAVVVPIEGPKAYYAIDSVAAAMWCVGDDCVLQYDGSVWEKFICAENV